MTKKEPPLKEVAAEYRRIRRLYTKLLNDKNRKLPYKPRPSTRKN